MSKESLHKTDRTTEMETFLTVICAGSLSAAARELSISPSAVSRTLTRLESRLGVRLIVRSTRRLHLTQEGEEYALAARRILGDLEQAEASLSDRSSPKGSVKVSAVLGHGRISIVPILKEFLQRYPDIQVEVQLSDEIADVEGGHVDVAIRFGDLADTPLSARKLGETRPVVVASPEYLHKHGHPTSPLDLAEHNCLDFSFRRIQPGWTFIMNGTRTVLPIKGNVMANNGETLVQLAKQGVGITRLGHFHIEDELKSGRLVALLEDFHPGDTEAIHAVYIGGAKMPVRVKVFVDFLAEKLAQSI